MENFMLQRVSEILHSCLKTPQLVYYRFLDKNWSIVFCYTELEMIDQERMYFLKIEVILHA